MNEKLKQYIKENIDLINADKWDKFFQDAPAGAANVLFEAKIEFLKYMSAIRTSMFQGNDKLTNIDIPNNILEVNSYAFAGCQNLKIVHLGDNIKSIGPNAFAYCIHLEDINIPNKVKYISDRAFFQCVYLPEIIISDSVHSIGDYAFFGCKSIKELKISSSVTYIGERTFADIPNNLEIHYEGTKSDWKQIYRPISFEHTYFIVHCSDGDIVKRKR